MHYDATMKSDSTEVLIVGAGPIGIELAVALKQAGVDYILDIALRLGFSSHSHFTLLFNRRFGLTPSAYRDRVRPRQFCSGGANRGVSAH